MTDVPSRLAHLDQPVDPLPDEPMTDLGYARRLIKVHGDRIRFVVPWNRWLTWDGCRWAADSDGQVQRCMKLTARAVTSAVIAGKHDKDTLKAAKRAESNSGVKGALALASTEPEIAVSPDQLDADPYLLNCKNGILDLRTGACTEHNPAALMTKVTGASYDPSAAGPEFFKFLERIQPGESMRDYLGRLLGHAL